MIGTVRSWLIGITCAAAIAAAAESMMLKGTVKKIGRGVCGLLLMAALLQPVLGFRYEDLAGELARCRAEAEGYSRILESENQRLMQGVIEEQTGAYIADKAKELGCSVTVRVECELDETGFPYPFSVTVTGNLTEEQKKALCRSVEADFAIPAERQSFVGGQEAEANEG